MVTSIEVDLRVKQTEGTFWRSTVKPQFDRLGLLYKRIESPISCGFPDTIILYNRTVTFMELKSKSRFERYMGCSSLQRNFLKSWFEEGSNTLVLAQVLEYIYLIPGGNIPEFTDDDIASKHSLLHGSRRFFPWHRITEVLVQK